MNRNLKLVINNVSKEEKQKYFFEKKELKIILDLYAKMVSEGSWKDYGLSISSKQVSFIVFKNAAENAMYKICKNFKPTNKNLRYLIIRFGHNTEEILINLVTSYENLELLNPLVEGLLKSFPEITITSSFCLILFITRPLEQVKQSS